MDAMRDSGLDDFAQNVLSDAEESAYDIIRLSAEANPATAQRVESVRDDVRNKWTRAWELFDACVFAGQQNGAILLRRSGRAKDEYAPVRDALILIHCAGVLTMQEIGALCKAGLWAGGAARWRALHELAVTATVIANEGVDMASRYTDHGYVVQTRRLQEFFEVHGRCPVEPAELERRSAECALLEQKYEDPSMGAFRDAYGWAAPLMPWTRRGDKRQRPTFEALERLSGLEDLRLLVFSAHGLVHNDSAGVVTTVLGEPGEWLLGPQARHVDTVARPALITFAKLSEAIQGGFEEELNGYSKTFILQGLALVKLTQWGAEEFMEQGSSAFAQSTESK